MFTDLEEKTVQNFRNSYTQSLELLPWRKGDIHFRGVGSMSRSKITEQISIFSALRC